MFQDYQRMPDPLVCVLDPIDMPDDDTPPAIGHRLEELFSRRILVENLEELGRHRHTIFAVVPHERDLTCIARHDVGLTTVLFIHAYLVSTLGVSHQRTREA